MPSKLAGGKEINEVEKFRKNKKVQKISRRFYVSVSLYLCVYVCVCVFGARNG